MSGSLNKVTLIGNLGRDPEVRYTQDGKPIVSLAIATSDTWRDKNTGERREKTEWHRVVIFNEALAKVAQNYLRKGSKIYIEGALTTREWQDQATGTKRYTTEVALQNYSGQLLMLDGRNTATTGDSDIYGEVSSNQAGNARYSAGNVAGTSGNAHPLPDDDIPF